MYAKSYFLASNLLCSLSLGQRNVYFGASLPDPSFFGYFCPIMKEDMYSRKEKIAQASLRLFAERAYSDPSTKEIAHAAGVSEALIFKHFGNKDSLLTHLIKAGYRRVLQHHRGMLHYSSAKAFLANMISLPSKLDAEPSLFWNMQERLSHIPCSRPPYEQVIKRVQPVVLLAFKELLYAAPHM